VTLRLRESLKHIEIDIHFVHDKVALGEVCVLHVPSKYQFAVIMTKGLPIQLFEDFRSSVSVCASGIVTLRLRESDRYVY